jgi:DNA-directed RNA polymerase specialized sigma24 family protein
VLVLRYFDDLTEAQTAVALDISVGTVKSHTREALARLRNQPSGQQEAAPTPSTATASRPPASATP